MFKYTISLAVLFFNFVIATAQETIPLDTVHWDITARSYVFEPFEGKDAIYLKQGTLSLRDANFLNGTIEYDIHMKETRGFPGVLFRINDSDAEEFYIRPHQSGNPDANQAAAIIKGITPWQLYFGPKYSFPYAYPFGQWMHVKIVVHEDKAQVYFDHADIPNLSWQLFHEKKAGGLSFRGGVESGMHLANFTISKELHEIKDFKPRERKALKGAIAQWTISDKFEEKLLEDPGSLQTVIAGRQWGTKINLEEGVAANISREIQLRNDIPGNTVFAKLEISAPRTETRLFEFGYSDRVVVVLNGQPIYKGNNGFRTRDYRFLGTIGLFDAVYLDLEKGKNTLLMAVSEDFGGWLVTGRFVDPKGLKIE